jgi:lycopene beta-cyclase
MDFRTQQDGAMRFFYVLPSSDRQALIEYVTCAREKPCIAQQEYALAEYLAMAFGLVDCQVERREEGASLLTSRPFERRLGRHVMAIGAAGGRIKPTTGYAFARIQRDSAGIVDSLRRCGHPFDVPKDAWRYRCYDAAMLEIMASNGERIAPIFAKMFHRNSADRIFRFLDEVASPWDDLRLAASLPPALWLGVLLGSRSRE